MSLLELSRINLNLLVCLQALLEERSVTKAADRLSLSQSAVSKSLSKLRQITGDELFTRTAHGLTPTVRALSLQKQLRPVMDELWNIIQPESFDPASCDRYFRIALPETANQLIFQQSLAEILAQAPGIKIKISNLTMNDLNSLAAGDFDLVVLPHDLECGQQRLSGLHCRSLHTDELVCLVRDGHPCLEQEWNLDQWISQGHISIGSVTVTQSIIDQTLEKRGLRRNMTIAVDDFHSATGVCESSDLVFVSSGQWGRYAKPRYRVQVLPMPFEIEPITYELYWHQRHHTDLANQWLRSFFIGQACELMI
ncbi:hypothetical protein EOPP23_00150 [Endozoicomonas sp. OPT23]|uniref:LysR family transcriptional regulator n=1 Tax=Endozoicomonas sp. OPT23 TaxID=2072845 RepID=UPI00129A3F75|nr:LysR family transcriptional regulator [Endozoicomonas sp. OPT23]MRI31399.1 hypothetical protein [Endozoicomonas sp. OPT23]